MSPAPRAATTPLTLAHGPAQMGIPGGPSLSFPLITHRRQEVVGAFIETPELAGKLRHRRGRDPLVPWGAGVCEG